MPTSHRKFTIHKIYIFIANKFLRIIDTIELHLTHAHYNPKVDTPEIMFYHEPLLI
jgi:hypothetical protein